MRVAEIGGIVQRCIAVIVCLLHTYARCTQQAGDNYLLVVLHGEMQRGFTKIVTYVQVDAVVGDYFFNNGEIVRGICW